VLVGLVLLIVIVGYALPAHHRASRSAHFAAAPSALFAAMTDVEGYPSWRSDVKRVELVPNGAGPQRFREIGSNGTILYEIERREPDHLLVTRIADPSLPFSGTWTQELTASAAGTTLRVTEDGEVRNPIFRFVSRFVIGHTASIDRYLADLGRRLGT
jgi:uncharacterized protein YndB with AHSA1/START domain